MSEFTATVRWTGNRGEGTAHYRAYDRNWVVATPGKPEITCSNDPKLGGDPGLHNPEDMLLSALSACHMLWYLHFASEAGVRVLAYEDSPLGLGEEGAGGAGRFLSAELRPRITVPEGTDLHEAAALHGRIHEVCFIARSVAFPVTCRPRYRVAAAA